MKTVFKVRFVLKRFLISAKECFQSEIQSLEKGWILHPFRSLQMNLSKEKILEISQERIQIRRNFRDELSKDFSNKTAFWPKSNWKPPPGHPGLELFSSTLEKKTFNGLLNDSIYTTKHI